MPAKVYLSKSGYCRNDNLIRVRKYILDSGAELIEHKGKLYDEQKAIDVDMVIVIGHKDSFNERGLFYTGKGIGGEIIRATGDVYIYNPMYIEDSFDVSDKFIWLSKMSIKKNYKVHDETNWNFKYYTFNITKGIILSPIALKKTMSNYKTNYSLNVEEYDNYPNEEDERRMLREADIGTGRRFNDFFKRKH